MNRRAVATMLIWDQRQSLEGDCFWTDVSLDEMDAHVTSEICDGGFADSASMPWVTPPLLSNMYTPQTLVALGVAVMAAAAALIKSTK